LIEPDNNIEKRKKPSSTARISALCFARLMMHFVRVFVCYLYSDTDAGEAIGSAS